MSKKKNKKQKVRVITSSSCRKIKRSDGLTMKWVQEYTFRGFLDAITSRFGKLKAYSVFGDDEEKQVWEISCHRCRDVCPHNFGTLNSFER